MSVSTGLRIFALCLLVGAGVLGFFFYGELQVARLKTTGIQTTATIDEALAIPGGRRWSRTRERYYDEPARYFITYTFDANGYAVTETRDLGLRGFLSFKKGSQVPVWYDASDPHFHSLNPSMNYSNLFLSLMIGAVALAAASFIFSYRAKSAADEFYPTYD